MFANNSSAAQPANELPDLSSSGDQTATVKALGTTAIIPPPTPDFHGMPIRNANSPAPSYIPQVNINAFIWRVCLGVII